MKHIFDYILSGTIILLPLIKIWWHTQQKKKGDSYTAQLLKNSDKLICDDFQIEKTISEGGKHLCPQVAIKNAVACTKLPF